MDEKQLKKYEEIFGTYRQANAAILELVAEVRRLRNDNLHYTCSYRGCQKLFDQKEMENLT